MRRALTALTAAAVGAGVMVMGAPIAMAAPGNDMYANATDLGSVTSAGIPGSNVDATIETNEYSYDGSESTVWYLWRAPADLTIDVNLCASNFDTFLAIYDNVDPGVMPTDPSDYNDDSDFPPCGVDDYGSEIRGYEVTGGVLYAFQVQGYDLAEIGSFCLSLNGGSCAGPEKAAEPIIEAVGKTGDCDVANGWSESWQEWPNGGTGGPVCTRIILWFPETGWAVARFDDAAGKYVPIPGLSPFGSASTSSTKSKG